MPTRFGGARHRLGIGAQQQQRHTRFFGSKGQAAAGSKIKFRHGAMAFDHHRAQPATTQRIKTRPQQRLGILRQHKQTGFGSTTQLYPTRSVDHPGCPRRSPAAQPDYRLAIFCAANRQGQSKARTCSSILRAATKNLMNPPQGKAAADSIIQRRHPCLPAEFQI